MDLGMHLDEVKVKKPWKKICHFFLISFFNEHLDRRYQFFYSEISIVTHNSPQKKFGQ
jgi:hypothetical protein